MNGHDILAKSLKSVTFIGSNFQLANADFVNMPLLETTAIGENCFTNASRVVFQNVGLPSLSITAKNFTNVKEVIVSECPYMESILLIALDQAVNVTIERGNEND